MRLIDADRFLEYMTDKCDMSAELDPIILGIFRGALKEQPTAYSVDKVVEEIEAYGKNTDVCISKKNAIEIVKHVGVADDVCEWRIVDRPNNLPIYNTSCGKIRLQYVTGVDIYCNGCGKKIKVVE